MNPTNSTDFFDEDALVWAETEDGAGEPWKPPTGSEDTWKVMLVDDDMQVHQVTKLGLKHFTFEGKPLSFISAYSGEEAKQLIETHPDTAFILLDVVMETNDAGLQVAQYIREGLKNNLVRLILRTGHPGEASEESVIINYDINDYKTKVELTQQKLITVAVAALRSYRDVKALENSRQALASTNASLEDFNQKLEQLVKVRTQELEEKNRRLQQEIRDRTAAESTLVESSTRTLIQNRVLLELARQPALQQGDLKTAVRHIAEALARTLLVERVNIWLYDETSTRLECIDAFDLYGKAHREGIFRAIADFPAYFQALSQDSPIVASNARTDLRTQELASAYFTPAGISSVLHSPVKFEGKTVGVVCVEQVGTARHWMAEDLNFTRSAADLVALALEARERQQVKEKLQLIQFSLDHSADDAYWIGLDGQLYYVNETACQSLGYSRKELLSLRISDINPTIALDCWPQYFNDQKQLGHISSFETIHRRQDGRLFPVEVTVQYLKFNHQEYICAFSHNISHRKQVEEALKASEKKYRNLVETSQDIIGSVDNQGYFTFVNPAVQQILGREPADMIGQPFTHFVPPEKSSTYLSVLAQLLAGESFFQYEATFLHQDGRQISLLFNAMALRDATGMIIGATGTASDITQHKQREDALRLIVEGTASKTGEEFFRSCVRYLAEVLQVRYALLCEIINESKTRARTLAFWQGTDFKENFEYDLANTPCEKVIKEAKECYFQELPSNFPADQNIATLKAQSYFGMPLRNSEGNLIGALMVLDVEPIVHDPYKEMIVKIFAARAGAELERKQMEETLERRARVDSLISTISRYFIDSETNDAINFSLAKIGEFTGADRSYILRYRDNFSRVYNTHEWCAEGIQSFIDELQDLHVEDYPWCYSQLLKGHVVPISCVADLPPEAAPEKAELERESIQSILYVPMLREGAAVGCIGLDAVHALRIWTQEDITLLKLVGDTIAIALSRDEAEKALQRSNARYQNLATNIPGMIYQFQLHKNGSMGFPYVSPVCREIYEVEPEEIISNQAFNFETVHPDDRNGFLEAIQISAQTLQPWHYVWRINVKGKIKWLQGDSRPELQPDGSIIWDGIVTDISDRKRAEEALKNSEEKFRTLFETLAIGIMITDRQGNIIQCNPASEKILGLSSSDLSDLCITVIGHQKQNLADATWQILRPDGTIMPIDEYPALIALRENRSVESVEIGIQKDNKQIVWLDVTATPIPLEGYGVQIAYSDITARKQVEEALRESEARLQKLTNTVPGMLYKLLRRPDGSLYFTYISSGCREIYELEPEQILGDAESIFSLVSLEDSNNLYESFETSARTLEPWFWEGRMMLPSGRFKWLQGNSRPEKNENGDIVWHGLVIDVTDRKLKESLLRESQQRLSFLVQQTPLAVIEWTNNFEILAWNPAAQAIFGYSQKEVIGQNILALLVPEESQPQISAVLESLSNQNGDYHSFNKSRTQDGRIIICEWYNTPLIDEQGRMIGGASMVVDITERKLTEQAMRESAERERTIARVIQRMRQTLDIEMIFRATSDELRQAINCDRAAVYRFNSDWSGEFVAESVAPGWVPLVQTLNESVADSNCIVTQLNSNSQIQDTYLQETAGGAYSRGVNCLMIEDIYEAGFTPCYINLLEEFQAKAYIIVPIFCGNKLWGLLATYQNSGPRRWSHAEINVVIQIGAQLGVALQQAELLAQTKKQSEALQQAVVVADAANRAKSEFLASMSHELRTPLNAILGFSQLMSRDSSLGQEQQENLGIINRAGEHLLDLINDILEMSKIEAGRTVISVRNVDLYRLLTTLEEMLRLKAQSKGLHLIFDVAAEVPQYVQTDEGKLRQVLINILGNALKFTEQGSVTLRVKAPGNDLLNSGEIPSPASPQLTRLFFEIEDTGPGIFPEEIDKLFEPFVQTKTGKSSQQGTGLGLPISQKFVQLMGGDIRVESTVNQGSLFAFDILVNWAESGDIIAQKSQQKVIGIAPGQKDYRILIADDLPESRLMLSKLFSSLGFVVQEAKNGREVIRIWERWKPDLIFMDMQMPEMDGSEATQHIKANLNGQETVIIALTANAFEEDKKRALAMGCNDFLGKPFREEILLEKVNQHLGVVYVYSEDHLNVEAGASSAPKSLTDAELQEAIAQMPTEWLEELYYAANQCSDDKILFLLDQIPAHQTSLASSLRDLANEFQFARIIELLQR